MTPTDSKRPFPSRLQNDSITRCTITPSYPFALHSIKALFLARQYRQCIQRCQESLSSQTHTNTVHIAFLNLYLALSHENLARLMHEYSSSKVPAYIAAELSYLSALDALRIDSNVTHTKVGTRQSRAKRRATSMSNGTPSANSPIVAPWTPRCEEESHDSRQLRTPTRIGSHRSVMDLNARLDIESPRSPVSRSDTDKSGKWDFRATAQGSLIKTSSGNLLAVSSRLSRLSSSMQLTSGTSTFESGSWQEDDPFKGGTSEATMPKATILATPTFSPFARSEDSDSPTPRGHRYTKSDVVSPFPVFDHALPSGFFSPAPAFNKTREIRYTTHLEALKKQLNTHIGEVRNLKLDTVTIQAGRAQERAQKVLVGASRLPPSRSFWSFKDPQAQNAERVARIEKGRARGWTRERFDPTPYTRLAKDAIDELRGGL